MPLLYPLPPTFSTVFELAPPPLREKQLILKKSQMSEAVFKVLHETPTTILCFGDMGYQQEYVWDNLDNYVKLMSINTSLTWYRENWLQGKVGVRA